MNKMFKNEGIMLCKEEEDFEKDIYNLRVKLWKLFNDPNSSLLATIYAVSLMTLIGLSVTCACVETLPSIHSHPDTLFKDPFGIIEIIINLLFTVDFVCRLLVSPRKYTFILSLLNWVDGIGTISYFMFIILRPGYEKAHGLVRFFRIIKVLCLFRISNLSKRIRVALHCLRALYTDFQVVSICFVIAFIFGGSTLYYAELKNTNSSFTSIPLSFWWAIQTITSVGYGDIIPGTTVGRCIAIVFMLCSVVSAALPVIWIVTKFEILYSLNIHLNSSGYMKDNRFPKPRLNRLTRLQNEQIAHA